MTNKTTKLKILGNNIKKARIIFLILALYNYQLQNSVWKHPTEFFIKKRLKAFTLPASSNALNTFVAKALSLFISP